MCCGEPGWGGTVWLCWSSGCCCCRWWRSGPISATACARLRPALPEDFGGVVAVGRRPSRPPLRAVTDQSGRLPRPGQRPADRSVLAGTPARNSPLARLRRSVPRLPVLRGAGPGSRAFGAHYRGGADVARRVRRPLSRPTSAGDVWAQPMGEALGWVPVGMSLLTGTYLLIAGRGGLVFVGGVPLRGHGAQLPVLGDCQDRGPQPGGGAAHG